jgi:hypothetical protein
LLCWVCSSSSCFWNSSMINWLLCSSKRCSLVLIDINSSNSKNNKLLISGGILELCSRVL